MRLLGLKHLTRIKKKNTGNTKLCNAIDFLINDFRKASSHDEYERVCKNNKTVIEKWLRSRGLIE
ncbi:MAG TPA: hypothetical protein DIW47_05890 [Bacteroidetes bacterium]|nr:hypothetical protein [Bacteroidota bacterium]